MTEEQEAEVYAVAAKMNSKTADVIVHDEIAPDFAEIGEPVQQNLQHIIDQRMVRTHDKHGVSLAYNRADRRRSMRFDKGDIHHPKQFHKMGHK